MTGSKNGADKGTLGIYGPKVAITDPHPTGYKDPLFGPIRPTGHHLCPRFDDFCVDIATGACMPEPDSGTHSVVEKPVG